MKNRSILSLIAHVFFTIYLLSVLFAVFILFVIPSIANGDMENSTANVIVNSGVEEEIPNFWELFSLMDIQELFTESNISEVGDGTLMFIADILNFICLMYVIHSAIFTLGVIIGWYSFIKPNAKIAKCSAWAYLAGFVCHPFQPLCLFFAIISFVGAKRQIDLSKQA